MFGIPKEIFSILEDIFRVPEATLGGSEAMADISKAVIRIPNIQSYDLNRISNCERNSRG